ncbi:hypothetical protein CCMA1212_007904 [Trichoderma ghanense]|uniref:Uncharacterized protein n=1 Tax=Trichoderma ghanense TaxID=65468 RepID=A0ABY2GWJ8_9HYPO
MSSDPKPSPKPRPLPATSPSRRPAPHVHVMEAVPAPPTSSSSSNYQRPRAALGVLVADLRDAPGRLAAVGPISSAFTTATSQEDFVRRLGRITLLENSAEMEAYIAHIQSE